MRRRTTRPVLTAAVALALVPLAGCTGVGSDAAAPAVAAPPPPEQAFGPNCAALPADGPGSLASMGGIPVLSAIDQTKDLSAMSSLIKTAKAKDVFDSMDNVTVFAPNDAAFAKLPEDQKKALGAQPGASDLLRRLIVVRDLRKADLADKSYTSLQGAVIKATGSGDDYRIGGAQVVCGSIRTANARLAVLDQVPAFD
ncbi:fasciclin domain-containing protein [Kitasatospora sp. NBC_01300]|uniref:fasciclin domain-containing protein n=1 Tax=Kitasatospora sp. NBC_01300 TaxID=2903574 RepID=UPI00352DD7D2|nr:fasciclin domain-containing protein [Kitasatospora sp. NBC_01300]